MKPISRLMSALSRRNARRQAGRRPERPATPVAAATIEALEERTLMYALHDENWDLPENRVTYSYANLFDNGMRDAAGNPLNHQAMRSAVEEALGLWASHTNLQFVERPDHHNVTGHYRPVSDDGYNPGGYPILRFGHHGFDKASTLGHGNYPDMDEGLGGDMHYNSAIAWNITDFLYTTVHELGHALGLEHANGDSDEDPPPVNAIMYAFKLNVYNNLDSAFLYPDDIAGIQAHYGQGIGFVLDQHRRMTIRGTNADDEYSVSKDAATNMLTVARSGYSGGSPGVFTFPADQVNEIVIQGRGGDDTLYAVNPAVSHLNVRFDGGAGHDRIFVYGHDGDDVFQFARNGVFFGHDVANFAAVEELAVDGLGGNDLFLVEGAPSGVRLTVDGGAGNDRLIVNDVVGQPLFVRGGGGDDLITVNGNTAGSVHLYGDDGNDNIRIVRATSDVRVHGGDGHDLFELEYADRPLTIEGAGGNDTLIHRSHYHPSHFDGGVGDDTLRLDLVRGRPLAQHDARYSVTATRAHFRIPALELNLSFLPSFIERVDLLAGDGHDLFLVDRVSIPTELYAGAGNDTVTVGGGDMSNATLSFVRAYGEEGFDTLHFDDSLSTQHINWAFFPTHVARGLTPYDYRGFENIGVHAGPGDNDVLIERAVTVGLDINTGEGHDTFHVNNFVNSYRREDFEGTFPVTLDGGGDADLLEINNTTGELEYLLDATTFSNFNWHDDGRSTRLTHLNFSDIVINGNDNYSGFIIAGAPAGASRVVLNGAGGDDVFHFRDGLDPVKAPVVTNGGGGADTLLVNDSTADLNQLIYTVNPSSVTRGQGILAADKSVNFTGVDRLNLLTGLRDDRIEVLGLPTEVPANNTINPGPGNNTIHLGSAALGQIPVGFGGLVIDGPLGHDSVIYHDANVRRLFADRYEITAESVQHWIRSPWIGTTGSVVLTEVHPRSVESYSIQGATAQTIFRVHATPLDMRYHLDGGPGSNELTFIDAKLVRGPVHFANGNVIINDTLFPHGSVAHVDDAAVGAAPGDSLFGPGGSLHLGRHGSLTLNLGAGADTIHVKPSSHGPVSINAGVGTDAMTVATAAALQVVHTPGGAGAGTYTFPDAADGLFPIHYTGVEFNVQATIVPGDADGNGIIDLDDYFAIDSNFVLQPVNPSYAQGDFNRDGRIDLDDYFIIDSAFLAQRSALKASILE